MIRVLLADDEELMRAGLSVMLRTQPDITVVGEASDGAQAVRSVVSLAPHVVLMDVRMPIMDGVAATAEITARQPASRVLVLTTFELDEYVFAAVRAGASGFLLKRTPPEALIDAVRTVASGEGLLGPSVTRRLLAEFARTSPAPPDTETQRRLDRLTDREHEVLLLMGRGLSNAEISARLYIGEATTKTHVKRVLAKLDLRDRIQAVVFAFDNALVHPRGGPPPPR
ncbi:LuxR family two component transcriptional regulator [Actinomadura pelletieri DSM 43383]|uniref:LuxR family two component transcriptional regulator n=1 Tax=Actinomadura pelletieri DSM 43383 TaxID=1120940 RepID=A0A495QAB0_9ACTN|nr:response regulator transcription factor [Actinomadura pelletieri]RKS68640.1 LuxR family two component transcriptional regulator [Actinomadura pelletieri DSM 43383]